MSALPPNGVPSPAIAVLVDIERIFPRPWVTGITRRADGLISVSREARCALDIALRLRAGGGGQVTAISWSPDENREALGYALAAGADRAVYLDYGAAQECDAWTLCRTLAQVMEGDPYGLILCGTQHTAPLGAPTAGLLAGLLDLPQVTRLADGEVREGVLYARRNLERGAGEEVVCPLPVVAGVSPAERTPPYVSLHRRRSVDMERIERRPVSPAAGFWELKELTSPRRRTQIRSTPSSGASAAERMRQMLMGGRKEAASGQVFEGSPQAAAERLYAYLQEHGFLRRRDED